MSIVPPIREYIKNRPPELPDFADEEKLLLARHPQLARPGPQPHNKIGTLQEQLALAKAGRHPEPLSKGKALQLAATMRAYPDAFRSSLTPLVEQAVDRILVEELPAAIQYLMARRR